MLTLFARPGFASHVAPSGSFLPPPSTPLCVTCQDPLNVHLLPRLYPDIPHGPFFFAMPILHPKLEAHIKEMFEMCERHRGTQNTALIITVLI